MSSERDILDICLRLAHQVLGDIEPGISELIYLKSLPRKLYWQMPLWLQPQNSLTMARRVALIRSSDLVKKIGSISDVGFEAIRAGCGAAGRALLARKLYWQMPLWLQPQNSLTMARRVPRPKAPCLQHHLGK
jgi:hypothetical protein